MPPKYHVTTRDVAPRYTPISKFASVEFEGCLGCLKCVKRESCIYQVYDKRIFDPRQIVDTAGSMCVSCMRCVQECKKGIISRMRNPDFDRVGDDYWTPDLILSIGKQSRDGKIPVSGSGYRGPFASEGFDEMWTDMSEIVRPTRDGIHGREYISTLVELGRHPGRLSFDATGNLLTPIPPFLELPIPIILDLPQFGFMGATTRKAMARAGEILRTVTVASFNEARGGLADQLGRLIVQMDPRRDDPKDISGIHAIEVPYGAGVTRFAAGIMTAHPEIVVSVRVPLDENAVKRSSELAAAGIAVIHLQADNRARGYGKKKKEFATTLVREVHRRLLADAVRDEVSVVFSGGIAAAEHVAKIIVCGVDAVGIDTAMLVSLECRMCSVCAGRAVCPVALNEVPVEWGARRIVNLVGAWHAQIIELLGAMGLREVRRLRGELGRVMFFDDLEKENMAPLFGKRIRSLKDAKNAIKPSNGKIAGEKPADMYPVDRSVVSHCPSRYRNQFGKFKVVRTSACATCGKCEEVCEYGCHKAAGARMLAPKSHLCRGPDVCRAAGKYCVDHCPRGALKVGRDPAWKTFGDPRWPADMLVSTFAQGETGLPPAQDLEYKIGESGGGFDRMELSFPKERREDRFRVEDVNLSIPLNRRGDGRPEVVIGFPIYGGGMSFGSVSLNTMLARARAYKAFNSFTCTGEGGYPKELEEFDEHVITQIATGLFGVREETIQRVRIVEFKYAQGAKPGLGGHLLGNKVTPVVADMREAIVGSPLFSPFPFHSVYSVEDHKKHVDWIKEVNPKGLVSVKVSTPTDVDMVAVGSYYAGVHIVHIDGSYGGTGAAPDIAKKNIAMPIEYAIPKVHGFLLQEGVRESITLIASGGIRSAWDVAKAIALGADGVVIGTAELVALECIRCGVCESGRGCPRGIATTDKELAAKMGVDWATQRLINLFHSWTVQLKYILHRFGLRSVHELVGRTDLLRHLDYDNWKRSGQTAAKKTGTLAGRSRRGHR